MDNVYEQDVILEHHGIKGQKWGIRRFQNYDGTRTIAGKNREQAERRKATVTERKTDNLNRRILSDADLVKRVQRLKLEKEYKNLVEEDIAPGRKFAKTVIKNGATKALTVVAAGTIAYAIKVILTKNFDLKDAVSYIAVNPNKK